MYLTSVICKCAVLSMSTITAKHKTFISGRRQRTGLFSLLCASTYATTFAGMRVFIMQSNKMKRYI